MSLKLQDELKQNLEAIYDGTGGGFRPDEAVIAGAQDRELCGFHLCLKVIRLSSYSLRHFCKVRS